VSGRAGAERVGEDGSVQREAGDEIAPSRVASFHLVREPVWRAPLALGRLGTDRLRLRGTPGLRFARLLGTGRGATAVGADLARSALFAVWDDAAALAAFEDGWFAERAARVRTSGGEVYGVRSPPTARSPSSPAPPSGRRAGTGSAGPGRRCRRSWQGPTVCARP
jgi:hypothetical protein